MRISLLFFVLVCSILNAAPPQFIPPQVMDLPKKAAMIDAEVQKELDGERKSLVMFDVHGIFTKETGPSADGDVTLNNRFIPTLKTAIRKKARILAVSAHDQPEVLYNELQSLRYGDEKEDNVFADFTKAGPAKKEEGFLLLPFYKGGSRVIQYTRRGDVVSAGLPNARYKTEKAAALLFGLLSDEAVKALSVSRETYEKIAAETRRIAGQEGASLLASANKYFPAQCVDWSSAETIAEALVELTHSGLSAEAFADKLNDVFEKRVCGRIKLGKRVYPNGKPSKAQKEATLEGTRDLIARLLEQNRKMESFLKAADIERARQDLFQTTQGVQLFYIEDGFENLVNFQAEILNFGYFEDAKIYLEYALPPNKDTQLTSRELDERIEHFQKKRSTEGDIKN